MLKPILPRPTVDLHTVLLVRRELRCRGFHSARKANRHQQVRVLARGRSEVTDSSAVGSSSAAGRRRTAGRLGVVKPDRTFRCEASSTVDQVTGVERNGESSPWNDALSVSSARPASSPPAGREQAVSGELHANVRHARRQVLRSLMASMGGVTSTVAIAVRQSNS